MSRKYRRIYMGMKYLKMYENYNKEDIAFMCRKYGIRTKDYTINPDNTIDVVGDVYICPDNIRMPITGDGKLKKLPLNFNRISGDFNCFDNELTTLEGCPNYVQGDFSCANNNLTILDKCPKEIKGYFDCSHNPMTSINEFPSKKGRFFCNNTLLENVYTLFPSPYDKPDEAFMNSLDYNYFREGNKLNKMRLTQALSEFGIECPENIKGYVWE